MRERISDVLSRRAAAGITRRGSLLTLGGAGLAAIFGGSATTAAKKHKKKNTKKNKEDPFALCAPQAEQCRTTVTVLNGNAAQLQCCEAFATCEASQFFLCLLTVPS